MSAISLLQICLALCLNAAVALNSTSASHFVLVSGLTSKEESCVVGLGSDVILDKCQDAIFALDGREIWSFGGEGKLANSAQSKCLGVRGEVKVGADVALLGCDSIGAAGQWEFLGNGQLKVVSSDLCLSLVGSETGLVNVASKAAAFASSTVDSASHGASAACDDDGVSFWASKFDVHEPVMFQIDLGTLQTVSSMVIEFQYVAQSFSVYVSTDGQHWAETFSTDSNVLKHVTIPLSRSLASAVKFVLRRPHAVHGQLGGLAVYGIRSIAVLSPQLHPVLESCGSAGSSLDARDKYFTVAVSAFDPAVIARLHAELPSLATADVSLSATIAQLSDQLATCHSKLHPSFLHFRHKYSKENNALDNFDEIRAASLFEEAKRTIISARSKLQ